MDWHSPSLALVLLNRAAEVPPLVPDGNTRRGPAKWARPVRGDKRVGKAHPRQGRTTDQSATGNQSGAANQSGATQSAVANQAGSVNQSGTATQQSGAASQQSGSASRPSGAGPAPNRTGSTEASADGVRPAAPGIPSGIRAPTPNPGVPTGAADTAPGALPIHSPTAIPNSHAWCKSNGQSWHDNLRNA